MNRVAFLADRGGHTVDGLSDNIKQTSIDVFSNRHRDGAAERYNLHATVQTVGRVHSDGTHGVLSDILLALKHYLCTIRTLHGECVVDVG